MDDFLIALYTILVIIFMIIFLSVKDYNEAKKIELSIKNAGDISNYLYSLNYGTKEYEKIDNYDKNFNSIPFEDIASYYIGRGYDIRWIKTGRYTGHYEAIKLKTN